MLQCDSHYRCCACAAAVLKCYGLVVQPPPPGGEPSLCDLSPPRGVGDRHDIGAEITKGA